MKNLTAVDIKYKQKKMDHHAKDLNLGKTPMKVDPFQSVKHKKSASKTLGKTKRFLDQVNIEATDLLSSQSGALKALQETNMVGDKKDADSSNESDLSDLEDLDSQEAVINLGSATAEAAEGANEEQAEEDGTELTVAASVDISNLKLPEENTKKKRKGRRKKKKGLPMPPEIVNDPSMHKYWNQRYRLFSKYDAGIQMDKGKRIFCWLSARLQ